MGSVGGSCLLSLPLFLHEEAGFLLFVEWRERSLVPLEEMFSPRFPSAAASPEATAAECLPSGLPSSQAGPETLVLLTPLSVEAAWGTPASSCTAGF